MGELVPVIATLASIVFCWALFCSVLARGSCRIEVGVFRGGASAYTACGDLLLVGTGVSPNGCLCTE